MCKAVLQLIIARDLEKQQPDGGSKTPRTVRFAVLLACYRVAETWPDIGYVEGSPNDPQNAGMMSSAVRPTHSTCELCKDMRSTSHLCDPADMYLTKHRCASHIMRRTNSYNPEMVSDQMERFDARMDQLNSQPITVSESGPRERRHSISVPTSWATLARGRNGYERCWSLHNE
ncbi:unnamed protein product [Strongylus vulgaris]|uniref:Uncharacterized protein n=1 Tax=Strongylus vulgaris TaxID=40348 RepID=A0A3P7IA78_STRVU|nr:unnamed protein product [Strongylus vulgaris]